VKKPELQFIARLRVLERDSQDAARFVYTLQALRQIAVHDRRLVARFDAQWGFWSTVFSGLTQSAVATLGRIYDEKKSKYGAARLIIHARSHLEFFTRPALAARKVETANLSQSDADVFASDAHEATDDDFAALRAEFDKNLAIYRAQTKPVRHQVYAHAGGLSPNDEYALLQEVMGRDMESLAVFPLQLYAALWQLYYNGYAPQLPADAPTKIEEVLEGLPGNVITWAHHGYVARDVAAFVASLHEPPPDASPDSDVEEPQGL
jgi:hypothetical protein